MSGSFLSVGNEYRVNGCGQIQRQNPFFDPMMPSRVWLECAEIITRTKTEIHCDQCRRLASTRRPVAYGPTDLSSCWPGGPTT